MHSASFTTLFDLTNEGFSWWPLVIGEVFAVFGGLGCFFSSYWLPEDHTGTRRDPLLMKVLGVIVFSGFTVLSGLDAWNGWRDYHRLKSAYLQHRYVVTEGLIANFEPVVGGHGDESFDIGGRRFSYIPASTSSAFRGEQYGFHLMANGVSARVYSVDGDIVRIAVRP